MRKKQIKKCGKRGQRKIRKRITKKRKKKERDSKKKKKEEKIKRGEIGKDKPTGPSLTGPLESAPWGTKDKSPGPARALCIGVAYDPVTGVV